MTKGHEAKQGPSLLEDPMDIARDAGRQHEEIDRNTSERMEAVHRGVENGETTGDYINDGLILLYGPEAFTESTFGEAGYISKNYHRIAESIRGRGGEPVLVIKRNSLGYYEHDLDEAVYLGILSEDDTRLQFQKGQACYLPAAPYVRATTADSRDRHRYIRDKEKQQIHLIEAPLPLYIQDTGKHELDPNSQPNFDSIEPARGMMLTTERGLFEENHDSNSINGKAPEFEVVVGRNEIIRELALGYNWGVKCHKIVEQMAERLEIEPLSENFEEERNQIHKEILAKAKQ